MHSLYLRLMSFALFVFLARWRLAHPDVAQRGPDVWNAQTIDDLLFYGVVGVILGGRLGYCLFYKPAYYAAHPLEVLFVWRRWRCLPGACSCRGWR